MEIKTNSMINKEANDEYFIPIQPDHAVALTMNFPQFSEPIQSKASAIQTDFDYNCPDCLADLFGPLMAPYAVLQKQSDAYRLRLEYIAYQRYMTMKSYLFDSLEKDLKTKWKSTFKHPFKYDIKGFLPRKAAIGRYMSMILSGWVFIIGIGILIFAIYLIFIPDHQQPMATLIRTLSKFYRTFFFQWIIGYLIFYSILLIVSTLCILLGAFVCSFLLTLSGILIVLMASALTIILPIIFIFSKSVFITKLERYMRVSIRDYDDIPENPITKFWTELQLKYSCCGLDSPISDYRESYFHTLTGEDVPASCCTNGTSCTSSPTITNSFIDQSCLPQAKSFVDLAIQVASIGHIVLGTLLLFILISVGVFFLYMKSAKKALDRYNQFIIKSMVSTLEQYEKEIGVFNTSIPNEINFHNKQQTRGILPITPTVIRVKNPRIMNYLGFD
ncbi:unnamed protein product [Rotaria socialis]|uniref:Tetraspanin n=1 Tax=Rotaria socialis TaxID=392032 RepID=A0A818H5Y0_9BILA|nr:unnamed protein product [Rotaria socialis]CAF4631538.1 unnamed protein product [Rotaria socialis]